MRRLVLLSLLLGWLALAQADFINGDLVLTGLVNGCDTAGSTGDAYVCTLVPAITVWNAGTTFLFKASANNTGPATFTPNSGTLAAKTIVKVVGGLTTSLGDNDILAGQWVLVTYDGTNLQLQSSIANPLSGDVTTSGSNVATVLSASTTQAGKVELATAAETTTGTDATRAVSPDSLAHSVAGRRYVSLECVEDATALTTGDGKCYWPVHADLVGLTIVDVEAYLGAAVSSSGAVNIDMDVCGAAATGIRCSGTNRDLLSTNMTIDANESTTETAATPAVITTANATLASGEWVRINIDAIGTGSQGLYVTFVLQKP